MKSAKVINKILLISLAFGSVTVVAGMLLARGNFKKTLLGVGATTSVASVAGVLINSQNKESNSISKETESSSDKTALSDSLDSQSESAVEEEDKNTETEINDPDLLVTELYSALDQDSAPNSTEVDSEIENDNEVLSSEVQENNDENEELEQIISPIQENIAEIEEESVPEIAIESEAFTNESGNIQPASDAINEGEESNDADINPFANASDFTESSQEEAASDLETVNKMFGTFELEEPKAHESQSSVEIENVSGEESDELLMEDEYSFGDDSVISTELEAPSEVFALNSDLEDDSEISPEVEPMSVMEDDSIDELPEVEPESADEGQFSFGDDSIISTELEAPSEVFALDSDLEDNSEISPEAEPMSIIDDESIDELPEMEAESAGEDEFSFGDDLAIASEPEAAESEFALDDDSEMDFAVEPMSMIEDESIDELPKMEAESADEDEFSFGDDLAIASEPGFALDDDSEDNSEISPEAEPMSIIDDESIDELPEMEAESAGEDEFSFGDDLAIASEPEAAESELALDDDSEMNFAVEPMPMIEDESIDELPEMEPESTGEDEFSFDDDLEIASEPEFALDDDSEDNSEISPEAEAMSIIDDESIDELPEMEPESTGEDEFSFGDDLAIASEPEAAESELALDDDSEMNFAVEPMPMIEDESIDELPEMEPESTGEDEFSFGDDLAIANEPGFALDDDSEDNSEIAPEVEPMSTIEDESIDELPEMEAESADEDEFSFGDDLAIANEPEAAEPELALDDDSEMDFAVEPMPMIEDESIDELPEMEAESADEDEFSFGDDLAIANEPEAADAEFSLDSDSEMDFAVEPMSMLEDESVEELPEMDAESAGEDEFSFGDDLAIASEPEFALDDDSEMDFAVEPMSMMEDESIDELPEMEGESADKFMGQFIDEDDSALEFGSDSISEVTSEPDESDFEIMSFADEDSAEAGLNFDDDAAISSDAEELWIDKESSNEFSLDDPVENTAQVEELNFEEFSFESESPVDSAANAFDDLGLNDMSEIADEPNEFMKELVNDNESALSELGFEPEVDDDLASASDSDEFLIAFENAENAESELNFDEDSSAESLSSDFVEDFASESKPSEELIFDETATNDSDFNDLMGAFAEDDDDDFVVESEAKDEVDAFELKFEDDGDFGELDSLDAVDQKLDELTEISEDSLGELNELLGSIQDNAPTEKPEHNEVYQDK